MYLSRCSFIYDARKPYSAPIRRQIECRQFYGADQCPRIAVPCSSDCNGVGCMNTDRIINLEIEDNLLIRINTLINIYSLHEKNYLLTGPSGVCH